MSFKLPGFGVGPCLYMNVFAFVGEDNSNPPPAFAEKSIQYSAGGEKAFFRTQGLKGQDEHVYLAAEMAHASYFEMKPDISNKRSDLKEVLDSWGGNEVFSLAYSEYLIKEDEIPDNGIFPRLSFKEESESLSLEQIEGTLLVEGHPIKEIKWSRKDTAKTGKVFFGVTTGQAIELNSDFFLEMFTWSEKLFCSFVLDKD